MLRSQPAQMYRHLAILAFLLYSTMSIFMLTRSVSELQRNMLKLSERIKASDARFSTHQLQELLNKEESSAKVKASRGILFTGK